MIFLRLSNRNPGFCGLNFELVSEEIKLSYWFQVGATAYYVATTAGHTKCGCFRRQLNYDYKFNTWAFGKLDRQGQTLGVSKSLAASTCCYLPALSLAWISIDLAS